MSPLEIYTSIKHGPGKDARVARRIRRRLKKRERREWMREVA